MTDQKIPLQTSEVIYQQPLEEETTFIDVLTVIVKKKALILLITSIFVVLSFCYYFLATPIYRANISFLPPPQEIYLSEIDPNLFERVIDTGLKGKNAESSTNIFDHLNNEKYLYRQFLTRVQSFNQQKEVLLNERFSEKFFGKSPDPENQGQRFIDLHNTVSFKMDRLLKPVKNSIPLDKPAFLEMEGPNPIAMAEFLNTLADSAKTAVIKETQYALQSLIDNRLKIATRHKEFLRLKANQQHLKKIQVLSDSLKIAQNLGIKNNNFHLLKRNEQAGEIKQKSNEVLQKGLMKLFKNGIIPQWFLYGEKALTEELKILNARTSQVLSNSHKIAQNLDTKNNSIHLPKDNDDIYIEGLVDLENQIKQLQSFNASTLTPDVILIEQPSIPPTKPINLKIEKVFSIGIGLGLFLGIIAAFLSHAMGILRDKKKEGSLV